MVKRSGTKSKRSSKSKTKSKRSSKGKRSSKSKTKSKRSSKGMRRTMRIGGGTPTRAEKMAAMRKGKKEREEREEEEVNSALGTLDRYLKNPEFLAGKPQYPPHVLVEAKVRSATPYAVARPASGHFGFTPKSRSMKSNTMTRKLNSVEAKIQALQKKGFFPKAKKLAKLKTMKGKIEQEMMKEEIRKWNPIYNSRSSTDQ